MSVQTLQRFSLQSIAKDIIVSSDNSSVEDFHRYKYVLGPFDGLNSDLIQELLNMICEKKQLKVYHLHVLLHSSIKHLDLSVCNSVINDQILNTLGYRCKKLVQLSLKNSSRLSTKALKQIPRNLLCIESINLSGCPSCTDDVLDAFGLAYPELKVLRVKSCSQITDKGIDALCGDDCNPRCRSLRDVSFTSTNITSYGITKLLLTQPALKSCSLAMTASKDNCIFSLVNGTRRRLPLAVIDLSYTSVSDTSVKCLCEACPLLREVAINCCASITEVSLEYIATLRHLKVLNIAGNMQIKFSPYMRQFLKKSGNLLEVLDISCMENIDCAVIGAWCRSLKCLIMADCQDIVGNYVQESTAQENNLRLSLAQACSKLNTLNLHGCKFAENKSLLEHLLAILGDSLEIQKLDLSGIEGLTDAILLQVIHSSDVSDLRLINLSRCSEVSVEPIYVLMDDFKSLKHLNLCHCQNISLQDVENLRKKCRGCGVSLDIEWL